MPQYFFIILTIFLQKLWQHTRKCYFALTKTNGSCS